MGKQKAVNKKNQWVNIYLYTVFIYILKKQLNIFLEF